MVVEDGVAKMPYPKSVFFIVSNEFCERFSFYGMKTILPLYLTKILLYSENDATVLYHTFVMLAYFFPLIGGIISDSWLGKYRTILYLSIIYAIGQILLSFSSVPTFHLPLTVASFLGLLLIAIGTGGIKPCVSAFGGDQFKLPQQEKHMSTFFSLFYFAVNSGSLLSTVITPILREDVKCYDQDTCFPLAFFVPAILMVVSIAIFFAGKKSYKIKQPEGNIFVKVCGCIFHAIGRKFKSKQKRSHWLDHAEDKYERHFLDEVKCVLKVLALFVPLPIFWALFDQQGSRWTFQAVNMNGDMFGYHLKPDQFQVANPLFILIFIALFRVAIYPIIEKFFFINTPLRKLTIGGILTGVSFVISALVEINIESTYIVKPESGLAQVRLFNTLNCKASVTFEAEPSFALEALGLHEDLERPLERDAELAYRVAFNNCPLAAKQQVSGKVALASGKATSLFLLASGALVAREEGEDFAKSVSGYPKVRAAVFLDHPQNGTLRLRGDQNYDFEVVSGFVVAEYEEIKHGTYELSLDGRLLEKDVTMENGAVFTIVGFSKAGSAGLKTLQVGPSNSVHMLWLLPQYVVITMGEIMFSITGLEFAFTQAPASMKSLLTSGWLLAVAFGNLIVVIIAEAQFFRRQVFEFLLFAGLMFIDIAIFAVMATFYKYVEVPSSADNSSSEDVDMKPRKGTYNDSYSDEY